MAQNWEPPGTFRQTMSLADSLMLAEQNRGAGRLAEAEALCNGILAAQPDEPNAIHLLGVIAHQAGRLGDAIAHLRRATKLAPDVALYHANLGEMCRLAGRVDEAVAEGRRAVALKSDYPEAFANLGVALYELKKFDEAAASHRRAIALKPDFALAHSGLGNTLYALKRFDEAIAAYRHAIALAPGFADAWSNLGTALHHSGHFEEAIATLRRALALAPDHANARSGLGILLLMRGDFAEGFDEYEWRLQSSEVKGPRFPQRPWQGENLAGKNIYVQAEQGFGDTIQFARYLPLLQARAGAVSFRVHQSLVTLMQESLSGIGIFGDRGTPAPADCEVALLSLPRLFKTRLETIPAATPYLRPPAEIAKAWQARLGALAGLKVGVAWAGRPEHVNNFRRSTDLAALAPLLSLPGISFVSLQVGPPAAELKKKAAPAVVDLSPNLVDFAETAGAVAVLDLVITVDTSVAHLAGALGKPVWVMLPAVTDWRWLLGREDNPWYPAMRLFRQRAGEVFADVVGRVTAELAAVAGGDAARLALFREAGERRAREAADIIAAELARPAQAAAQQLSPAQALMLAEQHRRAGQLGQAEDLCRRSPCRTAGERGGRAYAWPDRASVRQARRGDRSCRPCRRDRRRQRALPRQSRRDAAPGRPARSRRRRGAPRAGAAAGLSRRIEQSRHRLYEQENFIEALAAYDRALALAPDFADGHSNRGNALRALKRLHEAEAAHRRALALNPRFAQGWNNLGTVLRDLKRPQEAEEAYRRGLAEAPNDPDTLDNLALALKDLDRHEEAAELLRRALAVEARDAKLHLHLGSVLIDRHRLDEAAASLERALALDPKNCDAINLMGRVAFERGALTAALTHYRRALALKPDLADALNNMGNVLKELGRLDDARAAYLEAIARDPAVSGAYVNLADSMTFAPGDPHLAAMEVFAGQPEGLSETDRMQLDFALGKAYGDLKDHRRSFAHLLAGNARKRRMTAYDEAAAMALFDRIEATFTAGLVAEKSGHGDPSAVPIFVLGMPRSGTTLVEQILASHPGVHGAGELKLLNDVVDTVRGPDGNRVAYPDFVPALELPAIRQIGARYLAELRALAPAAAHVTDKMPANFFFAGLIHLALPNAPIIHTVRDPVDTCLSCFSKLFSAEQNHTYDLAELGRYYRRYDGLMAHWRRVLPQGRILDVRYEDVVADLEGQARRIVAHCGLSWDARCLAFHRTERPVRTASATQVRQPIYASAVGRWRVHEDDLGPLLRALGGGLQGA